MEVLERHLLVRAYGFAIDSLITPRGNPMGVEYLSVVTAACRAADELGRNEACRILEIKDVGQALKAIGVDRLFRSAGALQARVAEIVRARTVVKVVAKPAIALPPRVVLPARQSAQSKPLPAADMVVKPVGSDPFGRVRTNSGLAFRCICGCGGLVLESVAMVPPVGAMRDRQNGNRVGSYDLWRHAFAPSCIRRFGNGFSLKETMRTMMDGELKREAASRTLHPDFRSVTGNGGATGGSGKGASAAQLAKQAERAEKDRQIHSAMQSAGKR